MSLKDFGSDEQNNLLSHVVSQEMAGAGLKVISYAYKEITMESFNQLMSTKHVEDEEFRIEAESELIYVATFGLEDPIRDDIASTVH
jgi:magnesium-transporting ATPase (P-type)